MGNSQRLASLLFGGVLLVAGGAQAEGGYVGAGGARLLDYNSQDDSRSQGLGYGQSTGVGAFGSVGYRWDDGFSTELEGGMRGRDLAGADQAATGRGANESTALLMVNARLSPPVRGPLKPYAGVGAGVAIVSTQDHSLRSDRDEMAPAGQAMAGFSLDVSDRTSLFAEYRYFKLLDDIRPQGAESSGRNDESHAGFIGIRVRFGDMTR